MNFADKIILNNKTISKSNKPFIIAEIGSNFNQNLNLAKKLISSAKKCGADAVKFQLFKADILYPKNKDKKMNKLFKSIELKISWAKKLKEYSDKIGIIFFASAFDINSAKFLEKINVKLHKVASSELTNFKLINFLAKTKKPLLLSTGMSDMDDIYNALNICSSKRNFNVVVMQCGSMYPLTYNFVNLNVLNEYEKKFKTLVGFSDHTKDNISSLVALGKNSIVFEKHFTLNKKSKGPDHFYALEPKELKIYIDQLKKGYKTLGSKKKDLLPIEKKFSRREGIYFKKDLSLGSKILRKHLYVKRPPLGLRSKYMKNILGKKLIRNVKKNEPLTMDSLT